MTTNEPEARDELRFEVLKTVTLKKTVTVPAVAAASGIALSSVEAAIQELIAAGDVVSTGGHVTTTAAGLGRVRAYADQRYGSLRGDPAVQRWAARFQSINQRFAETVSAWSAVHADDAAAASTDGDHDDAERVLSRLEAVIVRVSRLLDEFSSRVPRMARYRQRLDAALEKIDASDERYVSDPNLDSVFSVWFEMEQAVRFVLGDQHEEA